MIKSRLLFVVLVVFLFSQGLSAQTVTKGRESKMATINFSEVAKYYQEHPLPNIRKPLFDEDEEERPEHPADDPALVHLLDRSQSKGAEKYHAPDLPVSPAPTDSFESTPSDHTGIPPDTHGAVDSQYCVTAINTAIHIQTRAGYNISDVSLDGFWNPLLVHGPGSFDPRVHYDPNYKKWIMVADAYGQTGTSMIFIAVSVTSDPTGSWHMYSINTDATGLAWMDFPNVGYNKKWIAVTGNMFPNSAGGANGAVIFIIDYASIMAGTGAPYTKFSQPSSFSICPTLTYDATEPNLFMLENWDNTTGKLQLWKVTGPVATPTLSVVGYPQTSTHWRSSAGGGGGDFLPQVGSTNKMDAGDDRITSCTYRNHKLWCSHTIFLPATGTTTHSSIMWWQVDTLAIPLQVGLINDASAATDYAYSSIAVNTNDDALVGFGVFSHTIHASGGYALHMNTDPLDSMRPKVVYRHGLAYYYETFGGGRDRWGDYSATCIDPRNDTDFWTIQESTIVGTSPNWDTWWANIQFCPKPLQPTMAYTAPAPCIGDSALYVINTIPGATAYVWTVSGTGWSAISSGGSDSMYVTAGTGVGTISVLAYNACGEGEAHIYTVTPRTTPHRPYISTFTPACVGVPTALFSATSTGATAYSWVALDSGWSGTSTSTSLTANVGTGTGMIICTPSNVCGTGPADTVYVTPISLPQIPTISTISVNCIASATAVFSAAAIGAGSYSWTALDSGWSGSSVSTSFTANIGSGTGMIICIPSNACGTGPADTIYVTPQLPQIPTISTSTINCVGSAAVFSATATGATSYSWVAINSGWSGTNIGTSFSASIGTGIGEIICIPINACGNGPADTIFITPLPLPIATFTVASHIKSVSVNDTLTFTGTTTPGSTYTWNFGGGTATPGTGAGPQFVHWATTGVKTVTLSIVDSSGCSSITYSDTVLVDSVTKVFDPNSGYSDISILPNPNDGSFDIQLANAFYKKVLVKMLDMQGRVVYSEQLTGNGSNKLAVTTNNLPNGTYMINVIIDGSIINRKVTIDR